MHCALRWEADEEGRGGGGWEDKRTVLRDVEAHPLRLLANPQAERRRLHTDRQTHPLSTKRIDKKEG